MSINYFPNKPQKLHSPLLEGPRGQDIKQDKKITGKRTYYNPNEENKRNENTDETLDKTLFTKMKSSFKVDHDECPVNMKLISSLEATLKAANILILSTGGILAILELINIIRTVYSGSYEFGNSLISFVIAFIGIIIASVICLGFLHLVKTTKLTYLHYENQESKIDKLITLLTEKT